MKTQTLITIFAIVISQATLFSQVSFTEITGTPFEGVMYSSNSFADVNNDGLIDIAISGESFSGVRITKIYINDGDYNFHELQNTPFVDIAKGTIALIDIDNDSDFDFFLAGQSNSLDLVAKIYLNNGQGEFTEKPSSTLSAGYLCDAKFADIDSDNDLDLFITGANYPMLFINDGTGSFTNAPNNPFGPAWFSSIAFSDFDNDGDQDLGIIGSLNVPEYYSKIYVNDGTGIFTQINTPIMYGLESGSIGFVDIDNSGFEEVFTSGQGYPYRRSNLYYFKEGSNTFVPYSNTSFTRVSNSSVDFADVNNDTFMDIISTGHTGNKIITELYLNNKNGTFNILSNILDGVYEGEASFVDIDNDNDMDVFITGYSSSGDYISKLYVNDLITGLSKENTPHKIRIYPNPSSGIITIQTPENEQNTTLNIISLTGQTTYQTQLIKSINTVDISKFPQGVYAVEIILDNGTKYISKVVLNK